MQRLFFVFLLLVTGLQADTVLVLPFFNYSKSPNLDWIGESIAESVRESMSSEGVLVLDREDRMEAYRRLAVRTNAVLTNATVIKIGEALDASRVIFGQYELTPNTTPGVESKGSLHIFARIIDLKHIRPGPEFVETGALEDLAGLENHLGWQSLQFVAPKTAPSEGEFKKSRPSVRLDALESYIRGLLATSAEQKHRYFTQAARIDGRYSQPCFQLGRIYWQKKDYPLAITWLSRVNRSDSHYMEAQFLLALSRYNMRDFKNAAQGFEFVSQTAPLNEVYNDLGAAQSRLNMPAAAENFRRAIDGDRADPDYHFNLGYTLWRAGKFSEAAQSFRAVLESKPDDAEAAQLLARCERNDGPRPGEPQSEGRERIKTNYEETAYRQLKAELQPKN
jgi:tetratricopeptide (TPR) repeat protein